MKSMSSLRLCAVGSFALLLAVSGVFATETFTHRSPGFLDRDALAGQQAALHAELTAASVARGQANPVVARATAADLENVERHTGPRHRVGAMIPVAARAAFDSAAGFGSIRRQADGWVWSGVIESPGATALRLSFDDFYLPAGAELYVFNERGQVAGPYRGRGLRGKSAFLSHTVFGSRAELQVRYEGESPSAALSQARVSIGGVGHMTDRFTLGVMHSVDAGEPFCNFNESCVENASCSNVHGPAQDAQDAAGHMLFQSGAFLYICSGGLLTDTAGSGTPYFLTANHCISKNNEAASLETFFQFTTPCNGACYDPDGVVPSTLGSTIEAKDRGTDMTLLRLSEAAPAGSAFLGWNSTAIAFSDGAALYRISHPSGAPQAYSEHSVDTSAGTCQSWPRGDRIYSYDEYGATEGGSSGSPVLNAAGQVVGQLSGACGTNVNETCDRESNATVDGAFANYYSIVQPILDGGGGCTDADGDGYCVEDDCDDSDASVNPGASENCSDGIDNDCDGQVDSADSDCGGTSCSPVGDQCSNNNDCCSNRCRRDRNLGYKVCVP